MHFLTLAIVALSTCVSGLTLSDILAQNNDTLGTLNSLLAIPPDLMTILEEEVNVTILAPNNDAFDAFQFQANERLAGGILKNPEDILELLQYHVLDATIPAANITRMPQFVNSTLTAQAAQIVLNATGSMMVELVSDNGTLHVLSGLGQMATIVTPDIVYDNGVIHIIDTVLNVPTNTGTTALDLGLTAVVGLLDLTAVEETFDDTQGVTFFAPVNDAFEAVDSIFGSMSTQQLTALLEYHMVIGDGGGGGGGCGPLYSTDLTAQPTMNLKAVTGQNMTVRVEDGDIFVNSARVLYQDILTSTGVMHIIDTVLDPDNTAARADPTAMPQPAFSSASATGSSVPFTSLARLGGATSTPASVPLYVPPAAGVGGGYNTMDTTAMGIAGGVALFAALI